MNLIGLDGCKKGGWIAARAGPHLEIVRDLAPLLCEAEAGRLRIVLDVPIGLIGQGRMCDAEARRLLKERHTSVFTPPTRAAFSGHTQAEASRLNKEWCGKGLNCQAFGILQRIASVDQLMRPELQRLVHEGHPEVTFRVLNGAPLAFGKKSRDGERERLGILERAGLHCDPAAIRRQLGSAMIERDDIIDAAVMLLTARRIEAGEAVRLPAGMEQRDERGLLAEMWA